MASGSGQKGLQDSRHEIIGNGNGLVLCSSTALTAGWLLVLGGPCDG